MPKLIALLCLSLLIACNHSSQPAQAERHYQFSGKVTALNAKDQTATVDAAAIPGFMEAMTMDYPIKSKADFRSLRVGESIKAIVNVRDGGYDLSNVKDAGK